MRYPKVTAILRNGVHSHFTTWVVAMFLAIGIVLGGFLGLGFFLWLINKFAEFALPFFAGMTAFFAEYHHGTGVGTALLIGVLLGGATFGIWRFAVNTLRTPILRAAVALPFALGSAVAGYFVGSGLSHVMIASPTWCEVLGIISAMIVGGSAWKRLAAGDPTVGEQALAGPNDHTRSAAAQNG